MCSNELTDTAGQSFPKKTTQTSPCRRAAWTIYTLKKKKMAAAFGTKKNNKKNQIK